MRKQTTVLLVAAVGAVMLAAGAGAAFAQESTGLSVDVTQADDGSATVSVTDNGTAVGNSTVTVGTADNVTYNGTGEYLTDENGTVGLPAPENETTVNVTAVADNRTATAQATLTPAEEDEEGAESFGQQVSWFVQSLQDDGATDTPFGLLVSNFVLNNNPAADTIPDHAGPPEGDVGPPEHAGPHDDAENETEDDGAENETEDDELEDDGAENETEDNAEDDNGPPEHAGPDGDDRGPPEHAGPDGDDSEEEESEEGDDDSEEESEEGDDEESDEEEESEEAEAEDDEEGDDDSEEDEDEAEEDEDDEDGEGGPPDHAGPR